ncbi:hypothetical protein HNY73_006176 [Argiope bruennichi]|uniref:Uncharacterized protein n=1 Tax=Argiope bruennichi TaxID=94029 RepID=A0A8T0FM36_ARGBR|nr:hypothetical protein HNY73_006176 [Argiope bruennichi]
MTENEKELLLVFRDEIESFDGHEIIYAFCVNREASVESRSFTLQFDATCGVPTSWNIGFFYEKVPETGKMTCSITLNRKDRREHIVNVFVLVTFFDAHGRVARFSEAVCSGPVSAGNAIQGCISDDDKREIINQPLTVRISVNIYNCHKKRA